MVCIAAFIILCLLSIFVAILSIFRRDLGKKYWGIFKKSWGCVGKKVTLQKCETNFKDDIKNSILKKFVIKKPKLVKPISVAIEIAAVLIVFVAAWSLVEGVKAGLALWTLGTCNVTHPASCSLGAEICSIDAKEPQNLGEHVGRWFEDWGEIFAAVPDKFRSWDTSNFDFAGIHYIGQSVTQSAPNAIDIFDPGCIVCLQSFKNQLSSGFFDDYKVTIVPYPIENPDGTYKFNNSGLITRYMFAVNDSEAPASRAHDEDKLPSDYAFEIIKKIFTEFDENHINYQHVFSEQLNGGEAEKLLQKWLAEFGYSKSEISDIAKLSQSDQVTSLINHNQQIVQNDINLKGIPTMIYDGKKHTGLFKAT